MGQNKPERAVLRMNKKNFSMNIMSLLDRIIESSARAVSPEEFEKTCGITLQEHMEKLKKLIEEQNKPITGARPR